MLPVVAHSDYFPLSNWTETEQHEIPKFEKNNWNYESLCLYFVPIYYTFDAWPEAQCDTYTHTKKALVKSLSTNRL